MVYKSYKIIYKYFRLRFVRKSRATNEIVQTSAALRAHHIGRYLGDFKVDGAVSHVHIAALGVLGVVQIDAAAGSVLYTIV